MINLDLNLTFYWIRFFVVLAATIIPFLWLRKRHSKLEKFYFLSVLIMVFIYCGAGAGWSETPTEYLIIYIVYMFVLGVTCHHFIERDKSKLNETSEKNNNFVKLERIINKYGKPVIILYILIPLMQLALSGKIHNLISPPSVDLKSALDNVGNASTAFDSLFYYLRQLLLPFYILSLYKYKDQIGKLSFALLFPLYIDFAQGGYLSRSGILPFVIIIYVAFYQKYPRYRKKMVIWTLVLLPVLLFGLSLFTFLRIGSEVNISFGDAIALLTYQETSYPIQYAEYQNWPFDTEVFTSYMDWLVKLPFPGFMKSADVDWRFNAIFTEKLTGTSRFDSDFSVALPGLVGESVFIFGKYFFWVHAILVGWVVSLAFRLVHHKQEFFLVLYMSVYAGVSFARAGTVSILPFYFKHLIIYLLVIYFITQHKPARKVPTVPTSPLIEQERV